MAAGTKRMVERNVIVRKLNALEALGGVTDVGSYRRFQGEKLCSLTAIDLLR
jgi:hypothetical protein